MQMTYKTVIADDHSLVCSAITSMVNSFPKFEMLYEVNNGKELLERFRFVNNIPDIVLLDLNMPIMDGFETLKILQKDFPDVKVIGLSMNDDEKSYMKFIELGGNGFVSKVSKKDLLNEAMTSVMEKGYFYTEEMTNSLFRKINNKKEEDQVLISKREKELLKWIGDDLTYQEISEKMFLSPKTIDGYRNSLFQKLNIKSRTSLAMFAVKHGYYTID